jgi:hypothetical protein
MVEISARPCCAACRLKGLSETYALMAAGRPGFNDLRRCSGAEWKRGPVERFTGPG